MADDKPAQADYDLRTRALVSVLTRKGLVDPAAMDAVVEYHERQVGPHIGAGLVARSWVDPDYRRRLLADARAVAREENVTGFQSTDLVAVAKPHPCTTWLSARCVPAIHGAYSVFPRRGTRIRRTGRER